MPRFNLEEYSTVEERIQLFYDDNEDGRITTEVFHYTPDDKVVVKATLFKDGDNQARNTPVATGFAEETPEGHVNKTSRVENCETSAVGRALANAGYQGKKRPSREEMEKVERLTSSKKETVVKQESNDATIDLNKDIDEQIEHIIPTFDKMEDLLAFNREMISLIKQKKVGDYSATDFQKWNDTIRERLTELKDK